MLGLKGSYQGPKNTQPFARIIWDKKFKNGRIKIYGRQPLKNVKGYGLLYALNFLKAEFHKFYLLNFWILCVMYNQRGP